MCVCERASEREESWCVRVRVIRRYKGVVGGMWVGCVDAGVASGLCGVCLMLCYGICMSVGSVCVCF